MHATRWYCFQVADVGAEWMIRIRLPNCKLVTRISNCSFCFDKVKFERPSYSAMSFKPWSTYLENWKQIALKFKSNPEPRYTGITRGYSPMLRDRSSRFKPISREAVNEF